MTVEDEKVIVAPDARKVSRNTPTFVLRPEDLRKTLQPKSSPLVKVGIAVLSLVLLGGIAFFVFMITRKPAATPLPEPVPVVTAAPAPTPTPAPAPTPTDSTPVVVTTDITIQIETVPSTATIWMNGVKQGSSLKLAKSKDPIEIEIKHPGYHTLRERIVPDVNQRLKLTLLPGARATPSPSASVYRKFE